jgi:hypothetical protein
MQLNDERLRLAYGSLLEGRTDGSRRSHPVSAGRCSMVPAARWCWR